MVTVDAQIFGNKRCVARDGLDFPPPLKLANLERSKKIEKNGEDETDEIADLAAHTQKSLAQKLTWDIVPFLRK